MKNLAIYVVIGLAVVAYNIATDANRDESGAIVSEGNIDAFAIKLGDCFNDNSSLASDEASEVSSIPGVPCSEPHDYEVFAVYDVDQSEYPGTEAMSNLAHEGCVARFDEFVGYDYESSALDVTTLYPTAQSWSIQGDREVICAIFDMSGERMTGTAEGSQR